MEKSSICHGLKVNWSRMAIDYCGHCDWERCPVSQQLQELLTLGSSTEPRTLLAVPPCLQGSAGTLGQEGLHRTGWGHTWNKPVSPQHPALLRCLSSLSAVGTEEAPLEPPSSLGTPCLPFHANTGSCWLSGWLAGYTDRTTFSHLHLQLFKEEQESTVCNSGNSVSELLCTNLLQSKLLW